MIKEKITEEQKEILVMYGMAKCKLENIVILKYKSGEFLCMEGHKMKYLLVVLEGKAKVCVTTVEGKSLLLCFYMSGGVLGDVELMMQTEETQTNVQALTEVTCIGIPLEQNKAHLRSDLEFMNYVGSSLARKLNQCAKNSAFTILHPLESRLCSYIILASEQGKFQERLTEVAELLGTSYRHLLRTMEQLCAQNILQKEKAGYKIVDGQLLTEKSDEYYTPFESANDYGRKR